MAFSHCNQPFTLKEIPVKQHLERVIEGEEKKGNKYEFILKEQNELLKTLLVVPSIRNRTIRLF